MHKKEPVRLFTVVSAAVGYLVSQFGVHYIPETLLSPDLNNEISIVVMALIFLATRRFTWSEKGVIATINSTIDEVREQSREA